MNIEYNTISIMSFQDLSDFRESQRRENNGRGNHPSEKAALKFYIENFGLTMSSPFMPYLGVDEKFNAYLNRLDGRGRVSIATLSSYKSRVKDWHRYAVLMLSYDGVKDISIPKIIENGISILEKKGNWNKALIARHCGMTPQEFRTWYKDGLSILNSTEVNIERAKALEALFDLPTGMIVDKLSRFGHRFSKSIAAMRKETKCRNKQISLESIPYKPKDLPEKVAEFFSDLVTWKSTKKALYRLDGETLEKRDGTKKEKLWIIRQSDGVCESADNIKTHLLSFYGWLMLPRRLEDAEDYVRTNFRGKTKVLTDEEVKRLAPMFIGKEIKASDASIAQFIDPELQADFADWREVRGRVNIDSFVATANRFLNPNSGILTQKVEYIWNYEKFHITPVSKGDKDWEENYLNICKKWSIKSRSLAKQLTAIGPESNGSRERVNEKLQPILAQVDLIGVIVETIRRHGETRPNIRLYSNNAGSSSLAIWYRDQLLLRMFMSNPLRNRNYREMTYTDDNRGNLYSDSSGNWRIRFKSDDFKNQKGAARGNYDVPLPADLSPMIHTYLTKARPFIIGDGMPTDKVFLNKDGKPLGRVNLTLILISLTARFMPEEIESFGIGSHAFRHIVATAWLRTYPEDYLTVAFILHDKIETVIENYSHMKTGDGMQRYNRWLITKTAMLSRFC